MRLVLKRILFIESILFIKHLLLKRSKGSFVKCFPTYEQHWLIRTRYRSTGISVGGHYSSHGESALSLCFDYHACVDAVCQVTCVMNGFLLSTFSLLGTYHCPVLRYADNLVTRRTFMTNYTRGKFFLSKLIAISMDL